MCIRAVLLAACIPSARAQFYNFPGDYSFSLLTERRLHANDSSVHPTLKPYIPFFGKHYEHVADTHKIFRFITDDPALDVVFNNHVINIRPKDEKFRLRLDPVLNLEYGRDQITPNLRFYNNSRGFIASGSIGKKFYFESMLAENQSVFPEYIRAYALSTGVVPGQGRWKQFKFTGFDYAFSSGFVSIQPYKNLNLQFGHGKHKIGNGYRSLLLSDNAFNYPYARITQQWLKGKLQYTNIYAVFMNLVQASKVINPLTERLFQKKCASFQQLSFNASGRFNVSLFQGLIWQAGDDRNRQHLGWQYFNPVIFANLAAYGLNHKNNILTGIDMSYKLSKSIAVYSQVMIDDLNGKPGHKDRAGVQGGVKYFDAFGIRNLFLQAEYNNVAYNSYTSPTGSASDQSYFHYNQNIAFTQGDGEELVLIGDYKYKRFFTNLRHHYQVRRTNHLNDYILNLTSFRTGYVINPSYGLNLAVGVIFRNQNFYNFSALSNKTNYIYLSLRTSIYNLYYDF
jgi:hypothetical protein